MEELRLLRVSGPTDEEASAVTGALVDTHSRNLAGKSAGSYWLFYLLDAYKGERLRQAEAPRPLDRCRVEADAWAASHGRAERIALAASREQLHHTFQKYFQLENHVKVSLEPPPGGDGPADSLLDVEDDQPESKKPRLLSHL